MPGEHRSSRDIAAAAAIDDDDDDMDNNFENIPAWPDPDQRDEDTLITAMINEHSKPLRRNQDNNRNASGPSSSARNQRHVPDNRRPREDDDSDSNGQGPSGFGPAERVRRNRNATGFEADSDQDSGSVDESNGQSQQLTRSAMLTRRTQTNIAD